MYPEISTIPSSCTDRSRLPVAVPNRSPQQENAGQRAHEEKDEAGFGAERAAGEVGQVGESGMEESVRVVESGRGEGQ